MEIIITTVIIVMFLILIGWTWASLGNIERKTKIICIMIGIAIVYAITFIIYNISKIGITYEKQEIMKTIRTVFVTLFSIINGYIILPYTFKKLEQINNDKLEKNILIKSIIKLLIIISILFIFETIYLGNRQETILKMMK